MTETTALTKEQIRYLRGICHHLKPVIMVGQKGLTASVLEELGRALDDHELVKVKVSGDRELRDDQIARIQTESRATLVQKIGHTACFFRRNEAELKLELPG